MKYEPIVVDRVFQDEVAVLMQIITNGDVVKYKLENSNREPLLMLT